MPLDAYVVGGGEVRDPAAAFAAAYGISAAGAVLVRPDGFVGVARPRRRGRVRGHRA